MDALTFTKLRLLSESKKLVNAVDEQRWDLYPSLNSSFQLLLKDAIEEHGSQLDTIGAQLLDDNDRIQQAIEHQLHQATEERNRLMNTSKGLKAYLKDSF